MTEMIVEVEGKDYTLCLNRAAVRYMEARGLDVSKFESQPLTQITKLIMAAFYGGGVRKPDVALEKLADAYMDGLDDSEDLMNALMEMYASVFPTRS